jgi:CheY-like chemotaxis protein
MIYAFTRQSGGHCRIETEVGCGTAIYLYLPRYVQVPDQLETRSVLQFPSVAPNTAGTILYVEQNPSVRELTIEVLAEYGHRVVIAEDGEGAMRILTAGEQVNMIVTDIGLPGGMTGRRLAELARDIHPTLKVLFITGYVGEAEAAAAMCIPGMEVLQKPFQVRALVDRVRTMLAAESAEVALEQQGSNIKAVK